MSDEWDRSAYWSPMVELIRTSDPAVLAMVEGVLGEAAIPYHLADRHMSTLWGSAAGIQPRVLVAAEYEENARQLLREAGLDDWPQS